MEAIIAEQFTRRHGVPLVREYLVQWKGLSSWKAT